MVRSILISVVVWVNIAIWGSALNALADDASLPDSLALPCSGNIKDFDCSLGIYACDQVVSEVSGMLNKMVDTKIKGFYQGLDLDLLKKTIPEPNLDRQFELPVCNLLEGEENNVTSTKHPMPASYTDCGKFTKFEYARVKTTEGYGTKEKAYRQGGYVQGWKCFLTQILDEIKKKKLKLSACAGPALEVMKAQETFLKGIPAVAAEGLCSGKGKDQQCTSIRSEGEDATAAALNDKENIATPKMSVCYLSTAQRQLENLFAMVAFCELKERMDASWLKQSIKMSDAIKSQIVDSCTSSYGNSCRTRGLFEMDGRDNPACVSEKFSACYERDFSTKFKGIIQTIYPDDGACQSHLILEKESFFC